LPSGEKEEAEIQFLLLSSSSSGELQNVALVVASDAPTVSDRERIGLAPPLFGRKTGKTNGFVSDFSSSQALVQS
jgi:hypothetical protein